MTESYPYTVPLTITEHDVSTYTEHDISTEIDISTYTYVSFFTSYITSYITTAGNTITSIITTVVPTTVTEPYTTILSVPYTVSNFLGPARGQENGPGCIQRLLVDTSVLNAAH